MISFDACFSYDDIPSYLDKSNFYNFIILDIKFGPSNGLDMIQKIRKTYPIAPIIILTAYTTNDYIQQAIREKVDAFIEKPLQFNFLEKTLTDLNCIGHDKYTEALTHKKTCLKIPQKTDSPLSNSQSPIS